MQKRKTRAHGEIGRCYRDRKVRSLVSEYVKKLAKEGSLTSCAGSNPVAPIRPRQGHIEPESS